MDRDAALPTFRLESGTSIAQAHPLRNSPAHEVTADLASRDAVDDKHIHGATVGNLIATLRQFGRNHLLVVENTTCSPASTRLAA